MRDMTAGSHARGKSWAPDYPVQPARWPFFYGWWIMFSSALGILASMPGQTMGFSVFIETLMAELGQGRDPLSLAYMIGTVSSAALLPWGGSLFDRWGARKTMVAASCGLGLVCLYFSFIDQLLAGLGAWLPAGWTGAAGWALAAFGFFCIRFTGQGIMSMSSTAMLGKWFQYRRGLAQSVRGVVISLGMSMTPLALNFLIEAVGWQGAYRVLAATCGFAMALFAWVFFRDSPEECGLEMDGDYEPPPGGPKTDDLVIHRDFTRGEALRTFAFWAFNLTLALNSFWVTGYTFHIISIGENLGISTQAILALFLPVSLVGILTNFSLAWLSDRTRLKYLLLVMTVGQMLGGLSYLLLPTTAGKVTLVLGMGIAGGAFGALSGIVWPRFFGRSHLGAISGFFMSSTVLASALGPILFSLVFTRTGTYLGAFLLTTAIAVVLAVGSCFADNPQRKLNRPG